MAFKRPLSTSPPSTTKSFVCKVCGDQAKINNYGALTCSPCKIFFRRHGFRQKNIPPCNFSSNCEMTILSRKFCTACRLAKCLAVGMNPDKIRKEDLNKNESKRKSFDIAKTLFPPRLPVLNLLAKDQSLLTTSDWTLISNVIHAFDVFTPVGEIRSIIEQLDVNTQYDLEQSLSFMSIIYSSLELFINSTVDFRIMTSTEQKSLIERNMHGLWAFHSCFAFREAGVFNNRQNEKVILPLYGRDNVQHTKFLIIQLDYDLTIIKLMLIILTFSSNLFAVIEKPNLHQDSLLYGTFRLFGSQNIYVKLLWNYMLYRYGFIQSVKRFSRLIKVILDMIQLASNINENNKTHNQLAEEIIEQTKHSLILSDHVNVSLWGKT